MKNVVSWIICGVCLLFSTSVFAGGFFDALKSRIESSERSSISYDVAVDPATLNIATGQVLDTISKADIILIHSLLKDKQYQKLNDWFGDLQNIFDNNAVSEHKIVDAFNVFATATPDDEPLLLAWLEQFPDSFIPCLALGEYYEEMGWDSRGSGWARDTTKEQFGLMQKYHKLSEGYYKSALMINPKLLPAYRGLIWLYNGMGEDRLELKTYQQGLSFFPTSFLLRSSFASARQPRWGGSYAEIEELANDAQQYAGLSPEMSSLYGKIYNDQASKYNRAKKYDQALALYTKALLYGDNWFSYYWRANIFYYRKKNHTKALADITRAIELRPLYDKSYLMRGKLYINLKEEQKSIDDLSLAIFHRTEDNHQAYYWRSVSYSRLNRNVEALTDVKIAIVQKPTHFKSYRMLDYLLAQEKRWVEIIDYWSQFLALEPDNGEAYFERSGSYYHNGNLPLAIDDLRSACSLGVQGACNQLRKLGEPEKK